MILDSYPRIVPDLYSGEPVLIRARARPDFRPGETLTIIGNSLAGAWSNQLPLDVSHSSPGIGALWARARIAHLLDARRRGADADGVRRDVVATAMQHHLVSPYTSMLAVDKTPERLPGEALADASVPNMNPRGFSPAALVGFPMTATPAAMLRSSGLLFVMLGLLLAAFRFRVVTPHESAH